MINSTYKKILLIAIIVIIAVTIALVSQKYLGNDNFVEETSEDVIEEVTGVKIDISPSDPDPVGSGQKFNLFDSIIIKK